MGVTPAMLRLLLRACKQHGIHGSVLTLGNQDVWATEEQIRAMSRDEELIPAPHYEVRPSTSALFDELPPSARRSKAFVHARTLFEMIGFEKYADLDKFQRDRPMILHDLNEPLPANLVGQFDLVADFGTTEHVFNVPNVLASVARSLKVGGWAMHSLPLGTMHWAQHGYYCFNPDVLIDFYRANGFSSIECRIVYYNKPFLRSFDPDQYFGKARIFSYVPGLNLRYALPSDGVATLWLVARKEVSIGDIRIPSQEEKGISSPSARSATGSAFRRLMRPLFFALEPVAPMFTRRAYLTSFGIKLSRI